VTRTPGLVPSTAAASVLVRDLLTGPALPASTVATSAVATYLDVGGRLVAVVRPGGVRLPCAVALTGNPSPSRHEAGLGGDVDVTVGGGVIRCGGQPAVVVTRWFDPRVRIRRVDPTAVGLLAALVRSRRRPDELLPAGAAERLADDLARDDARAGAAALLGRGTGLTPAGDDLLAGAVAALRAVGSPAAGGLGSAVRTLAPARTTRLSAALLDAADRGAVVPEVAAVLRAAAAGLPAGRDRGPALDEAVDELVGVGHTSGWHLAAGLVVGLHHALRAAGAAGAARAAAAAARPRATSPAVVGTVVGRHL
jgi:Protein of unknown function (DUF2877)